MIILLLPSTYGGKFSLKTSKSNDQKIVSMISKEIEIANRSDFYIKFSSENLSLEEQNIDSYSSGLPEKVKASIAKSPTWIQRDLSRQFQVINNSEEYAHLILNTRKKYTDEFAFSIACSPMGNIPPVDIIRDNAFSLYGIDEWTQYADIEDYDNRIGDYYSTIRYKILENGTEKLFEYPRDIYYWYIVHPKISNENCKYVYDYFWRDYYFNHNDLGYPLLKEKIANIDYLWDCESYFQYKNRLWKWSIESHPTAIEAISYWIGKTVPAQAIGTRPNQPNVIAHEHNGWCGELQRIATAAQRTMLIPSVGVYNIGEDHVWREYYERGWHENDNWWSDGGGAVDKPDVYGYGWGKNMSAVYAWNGDSSIYEVTSRYIHPEDRYTVRFVVKDIYLQPIDGARVMVFVYGIKDITWIKKVLWDKIQEIWDNLPQVIKGKIFQYIFNKMKDKYDDIPDVIDGLTTTIWNYTDSNGECTFELGRGHEYLFVIQQGNVEKPWQLAKNNAIRFLRTPKDTKFIIIFPDFSYKIQRHSNKKIPDGNCLFNISFDTKSYQLHKNFIDKNIGLYGNTGKIDFFVLDEENFKKYKGGKKFDCYNYIEENQGKISFTASKKDWYLLFRNHAQLTNIILDFSIQVKFNTNVDRVQIVTPDTSIFNNPVINVGDMINITGISTGNVVINIDNKSDEIYPEKCKWFFNWNTSENIPGEYVITADCGNSQDKKFIKLIDEIPPEISMIKPKKEAIVEGDEILISGNSWDNSIVESVEVSIDDSEYKKAKGTLNWSIEWDVSELELGSHIISVRAIDINGKKSVLKSSFISNESGHVWGPQINSYYHEPESPINVSNIIIYANVTTASPFQIKKVILYCKNNTTTKSYMMYRYGDNPVQDRHEEDPLYNESNEPIYGLELGQYSTGDIITYWIVSYDTANNAKKSEEKSFKIGSPLK